MEGLRLTKTLANGKRKSRTLVFVPFPQTKNGDPSTGALSFLVWVGWAVVIKFSSRLSSTFTIVLTPTIIPNRRLPPSLVHLRLATPPFSSALPLFSLAG